MPIYEYRCDSCGHELEAFQKLSEEPLLTCPHCSKDTLIKKISAAGFRLKGGGWYETDFKSGKKKNVSSGDSSSTGGGSADSKSSASTSSDSKSGSGATSSSSGSSGSSGSD